MSRIGRKPVPIVTGVKVSSSASDSGTRLAVEGPKGKLEVDFRPEVAIRVESGHLLVERRGETSFHRAYHGTVRSLVANMVRGVSEGFEKRLEIVGVGYNAKIEGKKLVLQVGFCHPVVFEIPRGLDLQTPKATSVVVRGADKQAVGEFAARVRKARPPEPYKGKGVRYEGEVIIRKAGKTFGSGE